MTARPANPRLRARAPLASEAGQALVEFAFLLPLFLVLVIGMMHFGKAFNYWIDETHLANEAARYAAVNKNPGGTLSLQEWIRQQANTPELEDGGTESVADPLEVCISFPDGPAAGNPVTVEVRAIYDWIPFLDLSVPGLSEVQLEGSATMRLEQLPTNYSAGCAGGAGT